MCIEKIYHNENTIEYGLYTDQGKVIGMKEVTVSGIYQGVEYYSLGSMTRQDIKLLFAQCEQNT